MGFAEAVLKKRSQFAKGESRVTAFIGKDYGNRARGEGRKSEANQSQFLWIPVFTGMTGRKLGRKLEASRVRIWIPHRVRNDRCRRRQNWAQK